jgi:hypothetical protein
MHCLCAFVEQQDYNELEEMLQNPVIFSKNSPPERLLHTGDGIRDCTRMAISTGLYRTE